MAYPCAAYFIKVNSANFSMAKIAASSPAKAILFGEHFVVWGAVGVACGIEPHNRVEIEATGAGEGSFEYETSVGNAKILIDGKLSGEKSLAPAAAAYALAAKKWPKLSGMKIRAKAKAAWPLKGVGNSASLCAALAAGFAKAAGAVASEEDIFEIAQESDRVAHGGSPSGIDATTVARGGAISLRKEFSSPPKFAFERVDFTVPDGWKFLLIDTHQKGKARANTAEQISKFAIASGMKIPPGEASPKEREIATGEYDRLIKTALSALKKGDMETVGRAMNENHAMLRERNVSCERLEKAVSLALLNGAAGAKLSGAGGEGSVALALCEDENDGGIRTALEKGGFAVYEFRISGKGAHAE